MLGRAPPRANRPIGIAPIDAKICTKPTTAEDGGHARRQAPDHRAAANATSKAAELPT